MRCKTILLLLPLLAACRTATVHDETGAVEASAPVIATDDVDSAWEYLAAKYDANGDGTITPVEYTREGSDIAKLDRNDDGVITAEDYASRGRTRTIRQMNPEDRKRFGSAYAARAIVLTYFQPDPEASGLHVDDLLATFDALDADKSGALDEAEFACATAEHPWGGPGRAWPTLLAAMGEGSEQIERDDLHSYHDRMSRDGVMKGPPGGSARRDLASDGAPAGFAAPDFSLAPPDGGDEITLSSFANQKPVALIFGSYT